MASSVAPKVSEGGYMGAMHNISAGSLAWTHSTEQGFVTVKVLGLHRSAGRAYVEVRPEGAINVAAAQAAAAVAREVSARHFYDAHFLYPSEALQDLHQQDDVPSAKTAERNQHEGQYRHQSSESRLEPWGPQNETRCYLQCSW